MESRILFVREIPEVSSEDDAGLIRVLAEVVWYDVANASIYVRDPTVRKGSILPDLLVKVDISDFRIEQLTGFKNAVSFRCVSGEILTILGKAQNVGEEEQHQNSSEKKYVTSNIGLKACYINVSTGINISLYIKAVEARRKYGM